MEFHVFTTRIKDSIDSNGRKSRAVSCVEARIGSTNDGRTIGISNEVPLHYELQPDVERNEEVPSQEAAVAEAIA